MANVDWESFLSAEERRRGERRHARLMFAVAFPPCLVIAALARLLPRSLRGSQAFEARQSIFREAKNAASMCIPFAFR